MIRETSRHRRLKILKKSTTDSVLFEPTLEKTLYIDPNLDVNTSKMPLDEGSLVTEYDSIDATKNWNYSAFTRVQARLEWDKIKLRTKERENYDLQCQIAALTGKPRPQPIQEIPFLDEDTNPGDTYIIQKKLVDRFLMGLSGVGAALFVLACVFVLLFCK